MLYQWTGPSCPPAWNPFLSFCSHWKCHCCLEDLRDERPLPLMEFPLEIAKNVFRGMPWHHSIPWLQARHPFHNLILRHFFVSRRVTQSPWLLSLPLSSTLNDVVASIKCTLEASRCRNVRRCETSPRFLRRLITGRLFYPTSSVAVVLPHKSVGCSTQQVSVVLPHNPVYPICETSPRFLPPCL